MAVYENFGLLVHAAAIEAGVAADLNRDRRIESAGDGVLAHRVADEPVALIGVLRQGMQAGIDAAHAVLFEIDLDHDFSVHPSCRSFVAPAPRSSPCWR